MAARRVENKVIVVTGAKSGIGRVTALMLAQQGAKLGLLDLVSPDEVAEEITRASGVAMALQCDVCSSEEVETAIQAICQQYGPLDGAANIAGVMPENTAGTDDGLLCNVRDDAWDHIFAVNVTGVKNCMRAQIRYMNKAGGSIVNAGSVSGTAVASAYNAAYGASKAAVNSLSMSVGLEMGKRGIRVNAVAPGVVSTPMIDRMHEESKAMLTYKNAMGRLGQPEEIASMFLYLLSDESSFCTAAVFNVDAGRR